MRALIDTNIIINRENNNVVPKILQDVLKLLNTLQGQILIHPKSFDEIVKDRNEERRTISLSKCNTYLLLESAPNPLEDYDFLLKIGKSNRDNDTIDNFMLYAVYRNAINLLITEDKEILKKASKLGVRDRVLSCEETLQLLSSYLPKEQIDNLPALRWEPAYNLDLNDPFFDSLKIEYIGFVSWFKKIQTEGRKCYVHFKNNHISALMIPKDETEPIDCNSSLPLKRRYKICLFKVEPSGNRIGELFLKLAVKYCVQNNIDEMYLTHFTQPKDFLQKILYEYGFEIVCKKSNGEDVYLKSLISSFNAKSMQLSEISRRFYPSFYDGVTVKKFIVPIKPTYHERLFIDYQRPRQTMLTEHQGEFIVEGNTINKAYLCHSNINKISKNDLLLFYRSHDLKQLTAIGTVQNVCRLKDPEKIHAVVKNRTVYPMDEIKQIAKKPTLVLLFKWHFYLSKPLTINRLKELEILSAPPQTITKIIHRKYLKIKEESKINERYTVY